MPLTKVSFSVIQVANNVTSTTVGNTTSIPSFTFDQNGVITSASNNTISVPANTTLTTPIISGNLNLDSTGTSGMRLPAANTLSFHTTGTEDMRITSAGDVGIGTSSPGNKLEVAGLIRATSLTNPSSGSGVELGYDGTQGVLQAFSNRATNTSVPINIVGDLKMNSGYGSSAVAYGCRAWVNFNGGTNTGGFCTIRGSGNVTTVADNGAGDYTINFTNAMPDANYAVVSVSADLSVSSLGGIGLRGTTSPSTTAVRVGATAGDGSNFDQSHMLFAIFR